MNHLSHMNILLLEMLLLSWCDVCFMFCCYCCCCCCCQGGNGQDLSPYNGKSEDIDGEGRKRERERGREIQCSCPRALSSPSGQKGVRLAKWHLTFKLRACFAFVSSCQCFSSQKFLLQVNLFLKVNFLVCLCVGVCVCATLGCACASWPVAYLSSTLSLLLVIFSCARSHVHVNLPMFARVDPHASARGVSTHVSYENHMHPYMPSGYA